jgi:hypothetical protein
MRLTVAICLATAQTPWVVFFCVPGCFSGLRFSGGSVNAAFEILVLLLGA